MKNYILTILAVFSISFAAVAQMPTNVEFDRKFFSNDREGLKNAIKVLDQGTKLYETGLASRKLEALPFLLRANDFNPNNARLNVMIGDCYLSSTEKSKAIPYLEKAAELPTPYKLDAFRLLGQAHMLNYNFDKAIEYFQDYKQRLDPSDKFYKEDVKYADKKIQECKTAKDLVAKPVRVFIDNIGSVVNSEFSEYGPVINADASVMYFTSCRPDVVGGTFDDYAGTYTEDIYVTYNENGTWTKPQNLGQPLNTEGNDAVLGLSSDGVTLFVFMPENGGDIGISYLEGTSWSAPKSMGNAINSPAHEASVSLSSDGRTLYFVSNRNNADGNHDIYFSRKDSYGRWTPAQSIGAPVNSEYDERAVFIHPNGTTLFFSSNGHNTMGGYDIFRTELKDGKWSKPENMGYPINTPDDDLFFILAANGRQGFFSSFRSDGYGWHDIYRITFMGEEKPVVNTSEDNLIAYMSKPLQSEIGVEQKVEVTSTAVTLLKGIVKDAKTKDPLLASIEITDNELGEVIATFETNSKTGRYLVSLPSGKNYGLIVKAENYLFHSENIDIRGEAQYQEIYKDIELNKVSVGSRVVLRNIFFESGKSILTKESITELNRLVVLMTDMPKLRLEISGHTDNVGSAASNKRLSEARAKAVVDYLVGEGINASRLTYVGYGFDQPIAPNNTAAGKAQNRRTEFKVLSNE